MQGPEDEGVTARQAVRTEEQIPARPYGGKAMLRMLELLEAEGLETLAQAAVGTTDEVWAEAVTRAEAIGVLPPVPTAERRPSRGSKKRAAAAEERRAANAEAQAEDAGDLRTLEALAATYAEVAEQPGPPAATGPQWRSVGPWTVFNGQNYGSSRVNVSGRVSALVDPGSPSHVLAGAANGGVWESRDHGASWAPRTDLASTPTIGALAFEPSQPSNAYCGSAKATGGGGSAVACCARSTVVARGRRPARRRSSVRGSTPSGLTRPTAAACSGDQGRAVRLHGLGHDFDPATRGRHLRDQHRNRRGAGVIGRRTVPLDGLRHDVDRGEPARRAGRVRPARRLRRAIQPRRRTSQQLGARHGWPDNDRPRHLRCRCSHSAPSRSDRPDITTESRPT